MRVWYGAMLAALLLALPACGQDATIHEIKQGARVETLDLSRVPPASERVRVGVYPTIVNNLDISGSTYDVTAYIWMRWKGPVDPVADLELANLVQRYDFTLEPLYKEPRTEPDGSKYQLLQVHGKFFQPFELENFPFDRQNISLVLQDEHALKNRIVFVPDVANSGFSHNLEIPGWKMMGWRATPIVTSYASKFGAAGGLRRDGAPGLKFDVVIARHSNYFLWKLFLPLLIVLSASWLALLIDPELVDVRTALPATSLLTLVFLQQSYSAKLPEIGTLVVMDKLYAAAYFVVLVTLVEVIAMASWQKAGPGVTDTRVARVDRVVLGLELFGFFAVLLAVLRAAGVI